MNCSHKISLALFLILIIYIYALFRNPKVMYNGPTVPSTVETADFDTLKKVAIDKFNLVKEKSGLFKPYNKLLMDKVGSALNSATELKHLAIASLMMPNNCIDLSPIGPLDNPLDSTLFQFEQGQIGWYWGYATYTNPIANIMYYIVRIELGSQSIREKYNLPLGSTTVYSVSLGIGKDGVWNYSPYVICSGKYEIFSNTKFRFTANFDTDFSGYTVFQTTNNEGEFKLDMGWNPTPTSSSTSYTYSSSTLFSLPNPVPPSFNGTSGCAPCIGGAGTLYWSYTQLSTATSLVLPSGTFTFSDGDGWLDHQWLMGNNTQQPIITLLNNLKQLKSFTGGLGRYLWINIHTLDSKQQPIQYMISCFPDANQVISNTISTIPIIYNVYSNKRASNLLQQTGFENTLTISKTTTINGITFPTVVKVSVYDFDGVMHNYVIDTTAYGDCVTIDMTGNLHWSGSALLYENGNKLVSSSAFLEANQFEEPQAYRKTIFQQGNFDLNTEEAYSGGAITIFQAIPSIVILVIPIIIIIAIVVFIFKGRNSNTV